MFRNRSKILLVCAILATIYSLYLIFYFGSSMTSSDSAEAVGGAIATALVTPHMICMTVGTIFSWLGFLLRKSWCALVGAILYCVSALLFMLYAIFCIPMIILGFVGYAKQRKILKEN